jgi:hypothetical protein
VSTPETPRPIRQVPPAQAAAHACLMAALTGHLENGLAVPCLGSAGDWVIDDQAAAEHAAAACSPCPALAPCRAYGRAWEKTGVYGGLTPTARKPAARTAAD